MDEIFNIEPLENFSNVSQEILSHLYQSKYDSRIDIEAKVVETAKEDLKDIIIKSNFDMHKVKETLQNNNSWNKNKINCFTSLLEEKKSELLYSALNFHNNSYGETVNNIDWILKLMLGTSELKSLRFPLLQLILSTSNCKGEQLKTSYDLTKEIVLKMIQALEEIEN